MKKIEFRMPEENKNQLIHEEVFFSLRGLEGKRHMGLQREVDQPGCFKGAL